MKSRSCRNFNNISWSEKSNKIINQVKGLYRIDSELGYVINDLNNMKHENCRHFDDYYKICILYRKCFNSNKGRNFSLNFKKYTQFDIHQKLIDLANKHVAHSDFNQYDKVFLTLLVDNDSGKAFDITVGIDFFEPFSCSEYFQILKLLQFIRSDVYIKIQELQGILILEYNQSIQ